MPVRRSNAQSIAATIISGMKPEKIGRTLGIGLRVAGRVAGQCVAGPAQPVSQAPGNQRVVSNAGASRTAGQRAGQASGGVVRGIGRFLRPFGRVGGIIWLEVAGVFFFLFTAVFVRGMWMHRASWAQGPDHGKFVGSAVFMLVFLYLGLTSFWRAWRK